MTKTGNGPIRRILVEAAGNDRFPARKTRPLNAKAQAAPERVQALAPETSRRKSVRFIEPLRPLSKSEPGPGPTRKPPGTVTTAVARELIERVGFIGAIVCEVADRPTGPIPARRARA